MAPSVNELVLRQPIFIANGTAVATFVNGQYPNQPHGNHAALFVRLMPDGKGIVIFDQWKGKLPGFRNILFGQPPSVGVAQMAEKFSVIM